MDEGVEPRRASTDEATVASGVELVSLKDGDAFLVADHNGDVTGGADGLFDDDTRVLSRFVFLVGDAAIRRGCRARVSRDNAVFTFHGTNRALPPVNGRGDAARRDPHRAPALPVGRAAVRARPLHQLRPRPGDAAAGVRVRRRLPRHVRGARHAARQRAARSLPPQLHGPRRRCSPTTGLDDVRAHRA